jgi:hypothetical protein
LRGTAQVEAKNAKIGGRNCTVGDVQAAQQLIKSTLMNKHGRVAAALRAVDTKGDGTLSRDEIIAMLHKHQLLKHTDYCNARDPTACMRQRARTHTTARSRERVRAHGRRRAWHDVGSSREPSGEGLWAS